MKTIKGWWFAPKDKKLANGDGRQIRIGRTHKIKGDIVPCERGLHLSCKPLDALHYAPGPVVYRVIGGGVVIPHGNPVDKYACSERTYVAGGVDVSDILWEFARMCALDVIDLWDAPDIVVKYLKTGDETIRASAQAQARASASARASAWESAWESARASARAKQNKRLLRMLMGTK